MVAAATQQTAQPSSALPQVSSGIRFRLLSTSDLGHSGLRYLLELAWSEYSEHTDTHTDRVSILTFTRYDSDSAFELETVSGVEPDETTVIELYADLLRMRGDAHGSVRYLDEQGWMERARDAIARLEAEIAAKQKGRAA